MSAVEAPLGDPVKRCSEGLRVFALAFDSDDIAERGGLQAFRHLLEARVPGLTRGKHFSLKAKQSMFGLKCLKVTFASFGLAELVYKNFLSGFILAYAKGKGRSALPLVDNPPKPAFWRGSRARDGYDWGELPGLVRWTLNLQVDQALQVVFDKILSRLGATRGTLPLFIDTNFIVEVGKDQQGGPVTVVEVMAFQQKSARAIAPTSDIQVGAAALGTLLQCTICEGQGHQCFTCPLPKLRVRLKGQALNLNVRNALVRRLAEHQIPVRIWGGRDPSVGHESRRFGYLAFRSEDHRAKAVILLSGPGPPWWIKGRLGPLLEVGAGLMDNECPLCGSNDTETRHQGLYHHRISEACPLSRGHEDQPIAVEILDNVGAQVPDSVRARQAARPADPTEHGRVRL